MPADPSIYSLFQQQKPLSPIETYGGALQIKSLIDQQALQELQRKQLMDADAENQRVRDLFSRGSTPTEAEVFSASPKLGLTYQKTLLENKKTQSEIDKNRMSGLKDTIDIFRNALGPVNDQASYSAWRTSLVKELPQFAGTVPEAFTMEAKRDLLLKADELGKNLTPRFERVDVGGKIEIVDMNPVTNPAVKSMQFTKTVTPGEKLSSETTRRGQDISATTTRRGQDLTENRERDVDLQGRIAAARESGKATVEAQQALPGVVQNAERAVRLIDELVGSSDGKVKAHPGFNNAVGMPNLLYGGPLAGFVPGTDTSDFKRRLEEIKGGAFLEAFQSLRGGGQITEKEGEKATAAITRMSTSQSEGEFVRAAREFQDIVRKGVERAKARATGHYAPGKAGGKDKLGGVLTKNADGSFNYGF